MLYLWGKERVKKLSVKNLKKQYGSYEAVKGISFELGEGECLGILGINGAGNLETLFLGLTGTEKEDLHV